MDQAAIDAVVYYAASFFLLGMSVGLITKMILPGN